MGTVMGDPPEDTEPVEDEPVQAPIESTPEPLPYEPEPENQATPDIPQEITSPESLAAYESALSRAYESELGEAPERHWLGAAKSAGVGFVGAVNAVAGMGGEVIPGHDPLDQMYEDSLAWAKHVSETDPDIQEFQQAVRKDSESWLTQSVASAGPTLAGLATTSALAYAGLPRLAGVVLTSMFLKLNKDEAYDLAVSKGADPDTAEVTSWIPGTVNTIFDLMEFRLLRGMFRSSPGNKWLHNLVSGFVRRAIPAIPQEGFFEGMQGVITEVYADWAKYRKGLRDAAVSTFGEDAVRDNPDLAKADPIDFLRQAFTGKNLKRLGDVFKENAIVAAGMTAMTGLAGHVTTEASNRAYLHGLARGVQSGTITVADLDEARRKLLEDANAAESAGEPADNSRELADEIGKIIKRVEEQVPDVAMAHRAAAASGVAAAGEGAFEETGPVLTDEEAPPRSPAYDPGAESRQAQINAAWMEQESYGAIESAGDAIEAVEDNRAGKSQAEHAEMLQAAVDDISSEQDPKRRARKAAVLLPKLFPDMPLPVLRGMTYEFSRRAAAGDINSVWDLIDAGAGAVHSVIGVSESAVSSLAGPEMRHTAVALERAGAVRAGVGHPGTASGVIEAEKRYGKPPELEWGKGGNPNEAAATDEFWRWYRRNGLQRAVALGIRPEKKPGEGWVVVKTKAHPGYVVEGPNGAGGVAPSKAGGTIEEATKEAERGKEAERRRVPGAVETPTAGGEKEQKPAAIPELTSTESAQEFGRAMTESQAATLRTRYADIVSRVRKLTESGKAEEALQLGVQGQFYAEALAEYGKRTGAIRYAGSEKPAKSAISISDLNSVVDSAVKHYPGAPPITVVQSKSDLPGGPHPGAVRGMFTGNAIWLVADNIADESEAAKVLLEEIVGHGGLIQALGDQYQGTMLSIWDEHKDAITSADLGYSIDTSTDDGRVAAADEWVSHQIASDTLPKRIWDRLVAAVRRLAKALGYKGKLSVAEVKALARSAVKSRPKPRSGAAAADINEFAQPVRLSTSEAASNITKTAKFKRWFGDSKVVDEHGEPLVVYHGTSKDFSVFSVGDIGFHFGTIDQAEDRAGIGFSLTKAPYYREGTSIIPVYLKIEKPLYMGNDAVRWGDVDTLRSYFSDVASDSGSWRTLDDVRESLIRLGYDGVIYENSVEAEGRSYLVFEPTQIKSIYNTGEFSPSNPDIRYQTTAWREHIRYSTTDRIRESLATYKRETGGQQLRGPAAPHPSALSSFTRKFRKWFGKSVVVDAFGRPKPLYHGTMVPIRDYIVPGKTVPFARGLGIHLAEDPSVSGAFATGTYALTSDYAVMSDGKSAWYRGADGTVHWDGLIVVYDNKTGEITPYNPEQHGTPWKVSQAPHKTLRVARPGGNILPVYARIENPLVVDTAGGIDDYKVAAKVASIVLPMSRGLFVEAVGKSLGIGKEDAAALFDDLEAGREPKKELKFELYYGKASSVSDFALREPVILNGIDRNKVIRLLEKAGYDGIQYNNTSANEVGADTNPTAYIVFHENQIKSVFNEAPTADKDLLREPPADYYGESGANAAIPETGPLTPDVPSWHTVAVNAKLASRAIHAAWTSTFRRGRPTITLYKYIKKHGLFGIPGDTLPPQLIRAVANHIRSEIAHPFPKPRKLAKALRPYFWNRDWYQEAGLVFSELFKRAPKSELRKVMEMVSATSKAATPKSNLTKALSIYFAVNNGVSVKDAVASSGIAKTEIQRVFQSAVQTFQVVEDVIGERSGSQKLSDYFKTILAAATDPALLSEINDAVLDRWMNIMMFPGKTSIENFMTGKLRPPNVTDTEKARVQMYIRRLLPIVRKMHRVPDMTIPELQAIMWAYAKDNYATRAGVHPTNYSDWVKVRAATYLGKAADNITNQEAVAFIRAWLSVEPGQPSHKGGLDLLVFDHYMTPERFEEAIRLGNTDTNSDLILLDVGRGLYGTGQPGAERSRHLLQQQAGIRMMHLYPHNPDAQPLPEMQIRGGRGEPNIPVSVVLRSESVYDIEEDRLGLWLDVKRMHKPDPQTVLKAEQATIDAGFIGIRTGKLAVVYSSPDADLKLLGAPLKRFSVGISPLSSAEKVREARESGDVATAELLQRAMDAEAAGDRATANAILYEEMDRAAARWPGVRVVEFSQGDGRWEDYSEPSPGLVLEGPEDSVTGFMAEMAKRFRQDAFLMAKAERRPDNDPLAKPDSIPPSQPPSLLLRFQHPLDRAEVSLLDGMLAEAGIHGSQIVVTDNGSALYIHPDTEPAGPGDQMSLFAQSAHDDFLRRLDTFAGIIESRAHELPDYTAEHRWYNIKFHTKEAYDDLISRGRKQVSALVPTIEEARTQGRPLTQTVGKGERVKGGRVPAEPPGAVPGDVRWDKPAPGRWETRKAAAEAERLKQLKSEHPEPVDSYAVAESDPYLAGSSNIWVRQAKTQRTRNTRRVLLVQISNRLMQQDQDAADYYDLLYRNRAGYHRSADFWEIPVWAAEAARNLPNADLLVVRDIDAAIDLMNTAGYPVAMFSAMDINKHIIKRIASGFNGRSIIGGYVGAKYFKGMKQGVVYKGSLRAGLKLLDSEKRVVSGVDYRHFKGASTIPRLEMSTGCSNRCKFCTVSKRVKSASSAAVRKQVEAMRDLDFELVYLNDKTFGQADNWQTLPDVYDTIRKYNPKFKGFIIQTTATRVRRLSTEFIKRAGIKYIELGVESYNDSILQRLRKPASERTIQQAADHIRKSDAVLIPNIIAGLAGNGWSETPETYAKTLRFLQDNADVISHVNLYNLALYANTELAGEVGGARTEADLDENTTRKSFHRDPAIHDRFYKDVAWFSRDRLLQGDLKPDAVVPDTGTTVAKALGAVAAEPTGEYYYAKPDQSDTAAIDAMENGSSVADAIGLASGVVQGTDPAASVKMAPGESAVIYRRVESRPAPETGYIMAHSYNISGPDDVAAMLASSSSYAQETVYLVIVDRNGNLLELHRMYEGTTSGANFDPGEISGRVLATPGAFRVYAVHNHPGGSATPSDMDLFGLSRIEAALSQYGIATHGMMIASSGMYTYIDSVLHQAGSALPITVQNGMVLNAPQPKPVPDRIRKVKVLLHKRFQKGAPSHVYKNRFGGPRDAETFLNGPDAPCDNCVLLLDSQMHPCAAVDYDYHMQHGDVSTLLADILKAADMSGGHLVIFGLQVDSSGDIPMDRRNSLANTVIPALRAVNISIMDVVRLGRPGLDAMSTDGSLRGILSGTAVPAGTPAEAEAQFYAQALQRVSGRQLYSTYRDVRIAPIWELTPEMLEGIPGVVSAEHDGLGGIRIEFANGRSTTIELIELHGKDRYVLDTGAVKAGMYDTSTKRISIVKGEGDQYTIQHELFHWMEHSGIVTPDDIEALNAMIKRVVPEAEREHWGAIDWVEARANAVETALRHRDSVRAHWLRHLIQRITDFLDAIGRMVTGSQTARGLIRDIETGRVYRRGRFADPTVGAPVLEFASALAPVDADGGLDYTRVLRRQDVADWFGGGIVRGDWLRTGKEYPDADPAVLYHGDAPGRYGLWLHSEPSAARESSGGHGDVYPVVTNISNPADLRKREVLVDVYNNSSLPARGVSLADAVRALRDSNPVTDAMLQSADAMGFDGAVLPVLGGVTPSHTIVAFDHDNIRAVAERNVVPADTDTQEFADWFKASSITTNEDFTPGGAPRVVYHGTLGDVDYFNPTGRANMFGSVVYTTTSAEDASSNYADPRGPDRAFLLDDLRMDITNHIQSTIALYINLDAIPSDGDPAELLKSAIIDAIRSNNMPVVGSEKITDLLTPNELDTVAGDIAAAMVAGQGDENTTADGRFVRFPRFGDTAISTIRSAAKRHIGYTNNGAVLPLYCRMEKPVRITKDRPTLVGDPDAFTGEQGAYDIVDIRELLGMHDGSEILDLLNRSSDTYGDTGMYLALSLYTDARNALSLTSDAINEAFRAIGYDGIILDTSLMREHGLWLGVKLPTGTHHVMPFRANQVKSVFNYGYWDNRTPLLLYSSKPDTENLTQYSGKARGLVYSTVSEPRTRSRYNPLALLDSGTASTDLSPGSVSPGDLDIDVYEDLPKKVADNLRKSNVVTTREKATEWVKNAAAASWRSITRHHALLDPKVHGELLNILRIHEAARNNCARRATDYIRDFTGALTPKRYDVFRMRIIMDDLLKDIESGLLNPDETGGLPFDFDTVDQIRDYADRLRRTIESDPELYRAYTRRQEFMNDLRERMVEWKLLHPEVLADDRYFHHQVLEYLGTKQIAAGALPSSMQLRKLGIQKARTGSIKLYNTNYIQAEFEVIAQSLYQIETAKALRRIRDLYDARKSMEQQAKAENYTTMYRVLEERGQLEHDPETGEPIDPLKPYSTRILRAMIALENMAASGELSVGDVGSRYGAVLADLAQVAYARKHRTYDPATGTDITTGVRIAPSKSAMFALLSELAAMPEDTNPGTGPALGVLKAIADRNAFIKQVCGKRFATWRTVMARTPGYAEYRPAPNTAWHVVNTITDRILDRMRDGLVDPADIPVKQVLARGADEAWAIPEEVAATLNKPESGRFDNMIFAVVARALQRAWKAWTLISPFRVLKYNFNNLSGDVDICLAYDPVIVTKYARQAAIDIHRGTIQVNKGRHRGTAELPKPLRDEINLAYRLDVIGSGWTPQEVVEMARNMSFEDYVRSMSGRTDWNIARRYWKRASGFTTYRENILRLAAFRYFRDQIAAGKDPIGVSNAAKIRQISDPDERAATLARELVGDYGNLTEAGQWLRAYVFPFWSWMEINSPRYVRLFRNIAREESVMRAMKTTGLAGAKAMARMTARRAAQALILYALVAMSNRVFWPDDDDKLSDIHRRQLHLIVGKRSDGALMTLRIQGALSDALELMALEDFPTDAVEIATRRVPVSEKLKDMVLATPARLIHMVRPDISTPAEVGLGRSFWPDPWDPRPIRDKWEHIARTLSIDKPYRWLVGKPLRGGSWAGKILNDILSMGFYTSDPGEAAYWDTKTLVYDYIEKTLGKERPSGIPTTRGNALYYYKQALRYGDLKAAKKYLKKYIDLGGSARGITQGIRAASPLKPLSARQVNGFLSTLTPKQRELVERATVWYNNRYIGALRNPHTPRR